MKPCDVRGVKSFDRGGLAVYERWVLGHCCGGRVSQKGRGGGGAGGECHNSDLNFEVGASVEESCVVGSIALDF